MMSFRSHEGFGQVPAGATSNGAAVPWWAPAPQLLLYGDALGQGKVPPEASPCREARFQVAPGAQAPLGPPVPPPPPAKAAAERGLPEVLKFSVAQGEDVSVLVRVCQ